MDKQLSAFMTGFFAFSMLEAFWTAPDYRMHGDISWQMECIWMGATLIAFVLSSAWWWYNNR